MFCSYRISTDKLSRGPSAIAEPLVGKCGNSSDTQLGKHTGKNSIFNTVCQMAAPRLGIFDLITSLIILTLLSQVYNFTFFIKLINMVKSSGYVLLVFVGLFIYNYIFVNSYTFL